MACDGPTVVRFSFRRGRLIRRSVRCEDAECDADLSTIPRPGRFGFPSAARRKRDLARRRCLIFNTFSVRLLYHRSHLNCDH